MWLFVVHIAHMVFSSNIKVGGEMGGSFHPFPVI